jgi:hypothetical protein
MRRILKINRLEQIAKDLRADGSPAGQTQWANRLAHGSTGKGKQILHRVRNLMAKTIGNRWMHDETT